MRTEEFVSLIVRASNRTLCPGAISCLCQFVEGTSGVPGDIIELGAYKGGTAIALAAFAQFYTRLETKKVFSFDTFAGMPEVGEHDTHHAGDFPVDFAEVTAATRDIENLVLVPGKFADTIPSFEKRPVSLLFMDCDLYESYKIGLGHFWPLVSPGGVVIFEDYRQDTVKGATRAIDEQFADRVTQIHSMWCVVKDA